MENLRPHPLYKNIEDVAPGGIYGAVVRLAMGRCPSESLKTATDEYDNFYIVSESGRIFYEEGEIDLTLPPRAEFKELVYAPAPALDGRIHRIKCRCGEVPDGPLFLAERDGSTIYCCPGCVPHET